MSKEELDKAWKQLKKDSKKFEIEKAEFKEKQKQLSAQREQLIKDQQKVNELLSEHKSKNAQDVGEVRMSKIGAFLGSIEQYSQEENWVEWQERLEQFFT